VSPAERASALVTAWGWAGTAGVPELEKAIAAEIADAVHAERNRGVSHVVAVHNTSDSKPARAALCDVMRRIGSGEDSPR
jgi:hypothetical protein